MPKYTFEVFQVTYKSTDVVVEAPSVDEAYDIVYDMTKTIEFGSKVDSVEYDVNYCGQMLHGV